MTHAPQETSTSSHVGLALVSCGLMLVGIYEATTAYGFWGSWVIAVVALTLGALGFLWVARAEAGQRGWTRPPLWLALLGVALAVTAVLLVGLGAACGGASGFSCGG